MDIILLERIEKLGKLGEVVQVKNGYARNYLLPQRKALRATPENKQRFENEREHLETVNNERRTGAEKNAAALEKQQFVLIRQASDTLQLYGSVTARDIAEAIIAEGIDIRRQQVRLDRPIKTLGIFEVRVAVHPEVVVTVIANVARSEEEAAIQADGGTVLPAYQQEALDEAADQTAKLEAAKKVAEATFDSPPPEAELVNEQDDPDLSVKDSTDSVNQEEKQNATDEKVTQTEE